MNTNPHSLEPGVPAPFHFKHRPDLAEEMCLDDVFRQRPADAEEAHAMGQYYPKRFNREDPMRSLEVILDTYTGLPSRFTLRTIYFHAGSAQRLMVTLAGRNRLRVEVGFSGPYAQLYISTISRLGLVGISAATAERLLCAPRPPPDGSRRYELGRVPIGYEMGSGYCALLGSGSGHPNPIEDYLVGREQTTLDLTLFKKH